MRRGLWTALGIVAAGLGLIGLALPVIPTVPFMIVAAFAFGRGSPRLRRWTIEHPTFGPPVRRWEEDGAISRRHKAYAVVGMAGSMGLGLFLGLPALALAAQAVCLGGATVFVMTRPDGPRRR
jgi:uncharacterized membrane protein YbaN (DUF454 family)